MTTTQQALLLQKSSELFKRYGVKSLTMDEIARELGMSKKTIYQVVENKADLVKMTMQSYLDQERKELEVIMKSSKNSVDEMVQMIAYYFAQLHDYNAAALNDLQKYYPESFAIYNDYRLNHVLKRIAENLKNGIKQGFYRSDLNADVISKIYISGIDSLSNQEFFPAKKYSYMDVYKEFLNYHLRGIVSPKGLEYLEEHNLFKK